MRTSKYLNKQFGIWTCVYVGINNVQGKKAKAPGKRNYYYMFERRTSDNKADKIIRLNSTEASKVYSGKQTVEDILDAREAGRTRKFNRKVTYYFGSF